MTGSRFVAFQVGRSNVGRRGRRVASSESQEKWNHRLSVKGFQVRASYGHTGNFIVESHAPVAVTQVIAALELLIPLRFCVFSQEGFKQWFGELTTKSTKPSVQGSRRATLGAVMDLDPGGKEPPRLEPSETRIFDNLAMPRVRAVWKLDLAKKGEKGRMVHDERHRDGGWGALADAMRRAAGGEWTARSIRTLEGLGKKL